MDYLFLLQNLREGILRWLTPVFYFFSDVVLVTSFLVPFVIYWCIEKKAGAKILFCCSAASFITNVVKVFACVPRPWVKDSRLHIEPLAEKSATGYSFPSGHATAVSASYFGMAVWQGKVRQKKRFLFCIILSVIPFLTAFSRNWLGAHTAQDVCTGLLIGAFCVFAFGFIFDMAERNEKAEIIFNACFILAALCAVIYSVCKNYPLIINRELNADALPEVLAESAKMQLDVLKSAGVILGFFTGKIFEKRFVKFDVPQNTKEKIIAGALGILTLGVMQEFLVPLAFSKALPEIKSFAKYFIPAVWGTFVYPAIFSAVLKRGK
ncbi:MAG: phosphatase PAP2 family protein [Treponema sp.]